MLNGKSQTHILKKAPQFGAVLHNKKARTSFNRNALVVTFTRNMGAQILVSTNEVRRAKRDATQQCPLIITLSLIICRINHL